MELRCRRGAAALVALVLLGGCSGYRRDAGSGDVAFRLAWNGLSDLDLFVEDPAGECIFFGRRESESGGILDVDCNSGTDRTCDRPVENVYWPAGAAPPGTYRFWVHAHSLIPAEAPLGFQVQVLLGSRSHWASELGVRRHQELLGPFVFEYPGGSIAGPVDGGELSETCYGGQSGVFTGNRR